MAGGVNDIKQHRWFKQIVWTDIAERRIRVRILFDYDDRILFFSLTSHRLCQDSTIPVILKISNYLKMNYLKHPNVPKKNTIYSNNFNPLFSNKNQLVLDDNVFFFPNITSNDIIIFPRFFDVRL